MIELTRDHSQLTGDPVKIKIVGVGGAGSNALDRIVLDGLDIADMVAMNTDVQALTSSVAPQKVQLGRGTTRGLGSGGDPEVGYAAGEEAVDEIRKALDGASMIFVCAGLGGGTGSGAAPLIASLAKEQGALVVAFATLPFTFEGRRRKQQAEDALMSLQGAADAVICFENDKMGEAVSPKAGVHQAFASADQTISQSVRAVVNLFTRPGLIHIGFDDLVSALRGASGRCLFGFGEAEGDNRAHDSLARALKNPLMDRGRLLTEADSILVNIAGGPNMTLNEVQILMDELNRHINETTRILFGVAVDAKLGQRMSVAIMSSIGPAMERPIGGGQMAYADEEMTRSVAVEPEVVSQASMNSLAPVAEPVLVAAASGESGGNGNGHRETQSFAEAEQLPPAPETRPAKHASVKPKAAAAPGTGTHGAATPARAKTREEKQETLQFEPVSRGRFEKSEPTIVDGQDLDVPTFLRRNLRIK